MSTIPDKLVNTQMESTRPDHIDNNTMKQQSQSSELTGSLPASKSVESQQESVTDFSKSVTTTQENLPPATDFMYNWIRKHSGK
jgi:hypothetical protein